MKVGIPKETFPGERRVGLIPAAAARLSKAGFTVVVEEGAGEAAGFPDGAYVDVGVTMAATGGLGDADLILKVQPPTVEEVAGYGEGSTLVALLQPGRIDAVYAELARRNITAFAMELVPRTTKAQSMDVLSSQATVAGYKAVLVAASEQGKLLPMLTTAAGTLAPAKAFIIGAGVAGLQALATPRRVGAIVSADDGRPVGSEPVERRGA